MHCAWWPAVPGKLLRRRRANPSARNSRGTHHQEGPASPSGACLSGPFAPAPPPSPRSLSELSPTDRRGSCSSRLHTHATTPSSLSPSLARLPSPSPTPSPSAAAAAREAATTPSPVSATHPLCSVCTNSAPELDSSSASSSYYRYYCMIVYIHSTFHLTVMIGILQYRYGTRCVLLLYTVDRDPFTGRCTESIVLVSRVSP